MIMSDLTGETFGQLYILNRHSSLNKQARYLVQCKNCDKVYDLATSTIKKNINGCSDCARANQAKGNESLSWSGGKYIPAIFLSNVKRSARKRSIPCEVSIDELDLIWSLQDGICAYTGRKLSLETGKLTASLDRIDSSVGYQADNVQFTHKSVNIMKWALPEEEFLQFVSEIHEFRIKNGVLIDG